MEGIGPRGRPGQVDRQVVARREIVPQEEVEFAQAEMRFEARRIAPAKSLQPAELPI